MDCLNPNLRMSENLSSVPCDPEKSTNVHLTDFLHNPIFGDSQPHCTARSRKNNTLW